MSDNDNIANALDISPMPQVQELTPLTPTVMRIDHVQGETEYETAKGNVENILKVGTEAMNDLLDLAKIGQDPRAYRVLTELITALTSANKELMDIKKKEVEIRQKEGGEDESKTVNNNLFVGSTSDLLKMLQKSKE